MSGFAGKADLNMTGLISDFDPKRTLAVIEAGAGW
jgi:hypothetical protein